MLTTQVARLECTADALLQLAEFVEQTGLTPSELGEYLHVAFQGRAALNAEAWNDLSGLCDSQTGSVKFARGLRREAEELRAQAVG